MFEDFFPDGKKIVTWVYENKNTVWLWDAGSGKKLQELVGSFEEFSSDGKRIITVDYGYTVRILDLSVLEREPQM